MILKTVSVHVLGVALILVIALIGSSGAPVAQEMATLTGTLSDPQGAVVANANIDLRWNYLDNLMSWDAVRHKKQKQPRKKVLKVSTDNEGRFSVTLLPGNWDVFAYRDGFAPICTIVLIEAGKTTSINLHFPRFAAMSVQ
jgi:hypothetical protein